MSIQSFRTFIRWRNFSCRLLLLH